MKIAVVMGGYSDESVISLKSGQLILANLDAAKHNVYEVHVLNEGWFALVNGVKYTINKGDFSFFIENEHVVFDVVLNTVHGTPGEDGHLQAYWDLIGVKYAGCSSYQSALTFNKRDTLSVLSKFGIKMAKSIYVTQGEEINADKVAAELGLPFMVKPNQSGSSLGISKVYKPEDLEEALRLAFLEDKDILMEHFLKGTEVSVGVVRFNEETKVLGVTEIVSENDFFDYEAKYLGKSKEITPARISDAVMQTVHAEAKKVYNSLAMKGFARMEFILVDNQPHFIEINTNPGLSPASIFPQQAEYAKIPMADLLENEIQMAMQRKTIWQK